MTTTPVRARYIYDQAARVATLLFAFVLALPGIGTAFSDASARSQWENRSLATFPSLNSSSQTVSSFFRELDDYLNDHFGFALDLNKLYRSVVYYVFGDSPSDVVTIGVDGYVFLNGTAGRGSKFDRLRTVCMDHAVGADARAVRDDWIKVLTFFEPRVPALALVIPPSKPVLYPEKLPHSVPAEVREACNRYRLGDYPAKQLQRWSENRKTIVIDLYDSFYADRFSGNFYPKENFHFSGASAHRAAAITLDRLRIETDAEFNKSRPATILTPDLSQFFGFRRRISLQQFDYDAFGVQQRRGKPDVRDIIERARDFGSFSTSSPLSDRRALVISDSFGVFASSHLAPGYKSVTWINTNALQPKEVTRFFGTFVRERATDDLIFLFHDGSLPNRTSRWIDSLRELEQDWPPQAH